MKLDEEHGHDSLVHGHGHLHVTHYLRHGEVLVHLIASYGHEHNHPAVAHQHEPHVDAEKEHLREGHIHDHGHPVE